MYPINCYQKIYQTSICENDTFCYADPNSFDIYLHKPNSKKNTKFIKLNNTGYYQIKPHFDRWPLTGYRQDDYDINLKFDLKQYHNHLDNIKPIVKQICSNEAITCSLIKHHIVVLMSNGMLLMYASGMLNDHSFCQEITLATIPLLLTTNTNISQIYSGDKYILFLTKDNDLYEFNLHDIDTDRASLFPTKIMSNVILVASGTRHTIIYDNQCNIYGYKSNFYSQICKNNGSSADNHFSVPKQLGNYANVKEIACGLYHSLVLLDNSIVLGSGSNDDGQLGMSDHRIRMCMQPLFIENKNKNKKKQTRIIKHIQCKKYSSYIIYDNGALYCSGLHKQWNKYLQKFTFVKNDPTLVHIAEKFSINININICNNKYHCQEFPNVFKPGIIINNHITIPCSWQASELHQDFPKLMRHNIYLLYLILNRYKIVVPKCLIVYLINSFLLI